MNDSYSVLIVATATKLYRCRCGHCILTRTFAGCICCSEIDVTAQKLDESEAHVNCITVLEGFEPVCLNVWVMQDDFFSCRQHYETLDIQHEPKHE